MSEPTISDEAKSWSMTTMQMINKLTPEITGKAFSPDWFLLRERLEQYETATEKLTEENRKLKEENETWHEASKAWSEVAKQADVVRMQTATRIIRELQSERDELAAEVSRLAQLHIDGSKNLHDHRELVVSIGEERDQLRQLVEQSFPFVQFCHARNPNWIEAREGFAAVATFLSHKKEGST